jgi:predicted amidohydrolase YtcJ
MNSSVTQRARRQLSRLLPFQALWVVLLPLSGAASAIAADAADTVFINGKVFTADAESSVREAFAVREGKFISVGTTKDIRAAAGSGTVVVDLKGRFVTPGLTDNHFHSEGGGPGVDLSRVRSLNELLDSVAKAAAAAPADAVVISNADWHEAQLKEQRLPTARELDRASSDKPVVLMRGGHSYILNTFALQKWHITKDTASPAGGQISRDAAGELTGELFDSAKTLVSLPPPPAMTMSDVLATQRAVNAYGITAVKIPGLYLKGNIFEAYRLIKQAHASGDLSLRYTIYLPGFSFRSAEMVRKAIEGWPVRQDEGDDWARIGGVKLGVDGGFEGGHMSEPYAEPFGKGGTYFGVTAISFEDYLAVVLELNRLGWRPTTHAVGDAAVEQVLKAYEAADAQSSIGGKRWSIEHAFLASPGQIARFRKLNVILSVQDHLYLAAPALKKYWGMPRASQVTPLKSYVDAGLLVTGGTDSPVVPFNPFWELYHFMTRDTISDGVYGDNQSLASRPQLLRLITINFAKSIGEESIKGSIEPGKLADFAVLSDDFLTVSAARVLNMKALATYVAGRQVYRDPSF